MSDVDIKIIRKTQDTLGKIIKKPPLTDKLLSRPPFRFIHDICTSVIKVTGVMKGLFTPEEMIADNVKDKDSKIIFLHKLIEFLNTVNEKKISIRVSSIIAGKEVEKTNEMLFFIAEAVHKCVKFLDLFSLKVDNDDMVNKALTSVTKNEEASKVTKPKHPEVSETSVDNPPSSSKQSDNKHSGSRVKSNKERSSKQKEVEKNSKSKHKDEPSESKPKKEPERHIADQNSSPIGPSDMPQELKTEEITEPSSKVNKVQRPSSAKGNRKRNSEPISSDVNATKDSTNQRLMSGRIEPTRPRKSIDIAGEEIQNQAPNIVGDSISRTKVSGLIIEKAANAKDSDSNSEDDQFVIEEYGSVLTDNKFASMGTGEHSHVVKNLMQSKKEFEDSPKSKSKMQAQRHVADVNRQRERAATENEIKTLSAYIQNLSRQALPLRKLMEYVQEDLENMQQEFDRWKAEKNEIDATLAQESESIDSYLEPLKSEATSREMRISECENQIRAVRAKIFKNDTRIQAMLERACQRT